MTFTDSARSFFGLGKRASRRTSSTGNGQGFTAQVISPGNPSAPARGTRQLLDFYNTNPLLRMVVDKVAELWAAVPTTLSAPASQAAARKQAHRLDILKFSTDRRIRAPLLRAMTDAGDVEPITDHPLLGMQRRPNPLMLGGEMLRLHSVYLDIQGESFWALADNALGVTTQAWPVPPPWVQAIPMIGQDYYSVSHRSWQQNLPSNMVAYFRTLDPLEPYLRGSGRGRTAVDEIQGYEAASKTVGTHWMNGALPSLLIAAPGLGKIQAQQMEEGWLDKLQGFWRRNLPHFTSLPKDAIIKEFSQDFQNMQLVEYQERIRQVILSLYGVAPELFGLLDNSNKATIQSAYYLTALGVLVPRCEIYREYMQERMVPRYDSSLIVGYESPVREDEEVRHSFMAAFPERFTVNEAREEIGAPPLPGKQGDVFLIPPGLRGVKDPSKISLSDTPRIAVPGAAPVAAQPPAAEAEPAAKRVRRFRM